MKIERAALPGATPAPRPSPVARRRLSGRAARGRDPRVSTVLSLVVAGATLLGACGEDLRSASPAIATAGNASQAAPADTTLVISSDPALREMASRMLPDLARLSGLDLREPVRLERKSRADLEGYLRSKFDEELPPADAEAMRDAYALLGLVPEDLDVRGVMLALLQEQVAGFYDPDSTALFVLEDQSAALLEPVLMHELVHAVQDQGADLDSLTSGSLANDRAIAAQAALEGHATLVMLAYTIERIGGDAEPDALAGLSGMLRAERDRVIQQYPQLAAAPTVVQESLLFPYFGGMDYVLAGWREADDGGKPAPFGPLMPRSTEQVLEPERLLADDPDEPTELRLELPAQAGATRLYEDGLGSLETGVLLREWIGPEAEALRRGWDGDRYILLEDAGGARSLVWFSVWDDEDARDAFLAALTGALDGRARPTRAETIEIEGRPGVVVRVGAPPPVSVSISVEPLGPIRPGGGV